MTRYDKVCQAFTKFFNQEELACLLDQKADHQQVEQALITKANLKDLEQLITTIQMLN